MAGSTYGNIFKITTWGESHGKALGVVVDGCPAGLELNEDDIQKFLNRRKPGQSKYTTQRKEDDKVEILSGVFEGKTTGTPISMIVKIKTIILRIIVILLHITDRDMQIIHLMPSTDSGIIVVVDVPPVAKPSDVLLPVPLPQKFLRSLALRCLHILRVLAMLK